MEEDRRVVTIENLQESHPGFRLVPVSMTLNDRDANANTACFRVTLTEDTDAVAYCQWQEEKTASVCTDHAGCLTLYVGRLVPG